MRKLLLALLLPLLTSIPLIAEEFTIGPLTYTSNDNSTASVSSCDKNVSGELIIPESFEYDGLSYSVTSIGEHAFWGCTGLTSVSIPNSVTSIGEYAFYNCSSLTSVTIPNSVTSIGEHAFSNCSSLTSVTIPNSVTSIGEDAFYNCSSLTSVTIPNSVTSIGEAAFSGCSSLTSVAIPNSVTSIGSFAFSGCNSLTNMYVEFGNPNYCSLNGALFNSDKSELVIFPAGRVGEYQIPSSVISIGNAAFSGCSGLTSVTIPGSVTSIGNFAFSGCTGLTSVSISDSVTSIGEHAFWGCTGLTSVTIPGSVTSIGEYAFYNCSSLTSVTIPNSVTSIGEHAFWGCTGLTSVAIPNSVTSIGERAFSGCTGLTSVSIPDSVTTIGYAAFSNCTGLTSVSIPNSVTAIGGEVFYCCSGLTSVTIPSSVTSIGYLAFAECSSLTSVIISGLVTNIAYRAFEGCIGLQGVYLYGNYNYDNFPTQNLPTQTKIYSFRGNYSGSNATYLDFLQPQHITPLMAGVAIDYSERFNSFDVDGYEIKSLKVTNTSGSTIEDIPLRDDGKYLVKLPQCSYSLSMVYFDPRAGRDITTTFSTYQIRVSDLLTIRNITTTESTLSFDYEAQYEDESTDFSEFVLAGHTVTDKKGRITLTRLRPGYTSYIYPTVRFKDGRTYSWNGPGYTTKDIVLSLDFQRVTPTTIESEWSYDAGDAADMITEVGMTTKVGYEVSDTTYRDIESNRFSYCSVSMPQNSRVEVKHFVRIEDWEYQKTETFTLPELVLNTVAAKATSNDCAIICAETNMSEIETNCGFEWRRYDAPELVPSNFVNCPVNNGMMAGKLMGLSSNTYYKYRPFYEDMNGNKTYGEWTAFGTADAYVYFEPTVYTYVPTRVARTSAVITGYALGGSDDVIEQGFEYSVVATSRAAGETVRVPATGTRMTATLTDLLPGTTYAVRAYATTAKETTYGEEQRFTTEGEEQDAIKVVEVEEAAGFDVYTLSGVCVRRNATDLRGLRPGIYIANGRKHIVR